MTPDGVRRLSDFQVAVRENVDFWRVARGPVPPRERRSQSLANRFWRSGWGGLVARLLVWGGSIALWVGFLVWRGR